MALALDGAGGPTAAPPACNQGAIRTDDLDALMAAIETKPQRRGRRGSTRLQVAAEVASQLEEAFDAEDPNAISALRATLRRRMKRSERALPGSGPLDGLDPDAKASVEAVGRLLELTMPEQVVLAFLLMLATENSLDAAADCLGHDLDDRAADRAIAAATGLAPSEVGRVFASDSRLMGCQLIKRDRNSLRLGGKWDWTSRGFASAMREANFDPLKALRDRVVPAPEPVLAWKDFAHLGELARLARTYVTEALKGSRKGVNLLLHGPAGTGKTQFARVLARELQCELYEVSTEDSDGDAIGGGTRLQALRVAQEFTARRRAMLCFDEIEDVFPRPFPFPFNVQRTSPVKGWVNRMLENNAAITFWLTNSVQALDAAFIRRFDLVLELKAPPQQVRAAQLRALPIDVSPATLGRLVECADLTPGVVHRAAEVVRTVAAVTPGLDASRSLELVVSQTLRAQGHNGVKASLGVPQVYDPSFISCDVDPVRLVEGLRASRSGRLVLFGPPGTGKTAFARHLASELGLTLDVRRASDLMDKFVGETEKRIAAAFRDAEESGAALLIDEVDSFLQDRSRSQRSWEVTAVNEFLTSLEMFPGLFFATTNLLEACDQGFFRRMDIKIRFDYLRAPQAEELLQAHLRVAGVPGAEADDLARLRRLDNLTPGDFAAVARQNRFRPLATPSEWVASLASECRIKPGARTRPAIGFGGAAVQSGA
ncbi:MAG: ATP-binding protein [Verrucomicrobia bacterium]|nr:ATP-binding protein [Verrucomicrobiota bacterium]